MAKVALAALCLAASIASSHAQEPWALLGVPIGVELASAYPECPKATRDGLSAYLSEGDAAFPASMKGQACYTVTDAGAMKVSPRSRHLRNLPLVPGMGTMAGLELLEGRIEVVEVPVLSSSFDTLQEAMTAKYGQPSQVKAKEFRTGYGTPISGRELRWYKAGVVVSLEEHRQGSRDYGFVSMTSQRYLAEATNRSAGAAEAVRAGL